MPFFDPSSASALPAPYWFVEFFKTFGFAAHLIPMGLWLIGTPIAGLLWLFGGTNARRLGQRLFQQTPIALALGINFGVVPLLFSQLAYSKAFYPPTILTAVHWFSILGLTLIGYYSSYLCASGAKRNKRWSTTFFALIATCCLAAVGLIFSSVWTLVERPDVWIPLWKASATSAGGAASGLATYWRDPIVYFRFASVAGLAFYAVSFWIVFDAFFLYRGPRTLSEEEELALLEAEELANEPVEEGEKKTKRPKRKRLPKPIQENPDKYVVWAVSAACVVALIGLAVAGPALYKYYFQALKSNEPPLSFLNGTLWNVLTFGTLATLLAPFLFLVSAKLGKSSGRTLALCLIVCEAATVGFFAAARQHVQNVRLAPYLDVRSLDDPNAVQWSPLFAFLGTFVVAVVLVLWLIRAAATAGLPPKKRVAKPKKERVPKAPKEPKASKGAQESGESKPTKDPKNSETASRAVESPKRVPTESPYEFQAKGTPKKIDRRR